MIDGLRPYSTYKQSGVPGLGEIPSHWTMRRLKHILSERDSRSMDGSEQLLRVSQYTGVTERKSALPGGEPDTRAESLVGYRLVAPMDLAVNIMLAWNGSLGVSRFAGIVSPAYGVYRFRGDAAPWYFHYLLRSPAFKDYIKSASTGVVESRLRLYTDDLFRLSACVPPAAEQTSIARFLDHADRCIRRYIHAKQQLIELLEEQKRAIIHRAVTHGLDPSVRLRTSGVEWLGNMPEHWELAPLKRYVAFLEGPGIMAADFREQGVPLLRISCLTGTVATLRGCNFLDPSDVAKRWAHFAVEPGDYLLSASGSLGTIARSSEAVVGAIPYTGIIRLWPRRADAVEMEYVRYFMTSDLFAAQVSFMKAGVGLEHFGPTHLNRMLLLLPPRAEQERIVAELEAQTATLDASISSSRREVDLLNELRSNLVAEVVTGKLDVRAAAARIPAGTVDPTDPSGGESLIEDATGDETCLDTVLVESEL